jgi:hypothetical protein
VSRQADAKTWLKFTRTIEEQSVTFDLIESADMIKQNASFSKSA